jgi:hypothetical protein
MLLGRQLSGKNPENNRVELMARKKTLGMSITALVFGIISIAFCWLPIFNILCSIVALILGIISLNKIKKNPSLDGKGFAIAAIALGCIGIFLGIIMTSIVMLAYFGVLSPSNMVP